MRRLISALVCVLLTGCFTAGKRGGDSAMMVFDFGLPPQDSSVTSRSTPIAVEVRAPLWLDALGINYRLGYADPARLREYTQSRWAGPPAQMVQQRLAYQLGMVVAGQGQARCLMRVDMTEFSQHFSTPESSVGVLRGYAVLFDRSRRRLADLPLNIKAPAPTPDARGGVAALTIAVDRLTGILVAWEAGLKADKAVACFD